MIEKSRSAIHVAGSEPASSELTTELHGGTRFPTGLFRPSLGVLFQLVFMISVADVTSVEFAGGNVRLAWIALPLLMLMLPAGGGERFFALATFALFLVHIISALASGAILKGLVYSGWIIVNYICFFRPAIILTRRMGSRVWGAIIWGGRFQCAIAVLLVFAGLHERARFIYFEPSYFAIGLVPYIFSVIFIAEKKALDLALLALTFSFSLSANMMIALSMAAACWLIYERRFVSTLFLVVLVCGAIFAVYRHALVNEMDANHNLAAWISENGFSVEFLDTLFRRAGNRLPRIEAAIEISRENWWFGVGPGNYVSVTAPMNFDHITGGIAHLDPAGLPAINIILEAVVNAGLGSAILIVVVFMTALIRASHVLDHRERWAIIGMLVTLAFMLQFESGYLRAYLWFFFGIFIARSDVKTERHHFAGSSGSRP